MFALNVYPLYVFLKHRISIFVMNVLRSTHGRIQRSTHGRIQRSTHGRIQHTISVKCLLGVISD